MEQICFGLINGMLFLKLFTVIFMKIAGIQGINSAPITIYAVVIISIIMMTVVLISMMQCYRFVRNLKDENSLRFKEGHEKSCFFYFTHKNNHVTVKRPDKEWEGKVV